MVNHFQKLSAAVLRNSIFQFQTLKEAETTLVTSKVFDSYKISLPNARLLNQFVEYVAKGKQDQDQAEAILKNHPELRSYLLSQKVQVTDYSKRTFFSITALQYAAWALDRHMWTMLKEYMSPDEMKKQLDEMERAGGVLRMAFVHKY